MFHDVLALKVLVSQPAYCFALDVNSEGRQAECQAHLKKLFDVLQAYDSKHGLLPSAAFYPAHPLTDKNSLRVLLDVKNAALFTCPTCSPDLQRMGLNYAWNKQVNGRKLSDLKDPANTWLLTDFVGAHDWMVSNGYCGHRRGVNILYADGTVKWSPPFVSAMEAKTESSSWLNWAKESAARLPELLGGVEPLATAFVPGDLDQAS